jgi:hypothetical protein
MSESWYLKAFAPFDGAGDALKGCIYSLPSCSFAKLGTFGHCVD